MGSVESLLFLETSDLVRDARAVVLGGLLVAITYFFAAGQQKLQGLVKSRRSHAFGPEAAC
jgi:hypothetical protein